MVSLLALGTLVASIRWRAMPYPRAQPQSALQKGASTFWPMGVSLFIRAPIYGLPDKGEPKLKRIIGS